MDDAIKSQDIGPAFEIFKVYLQRVDQRVAHARSLLKQDFDFSAKEQYRYDREDAQWAASEAELDALWLQSVKNDVLRLKLAGRPMAEIRSTLDKRYGNLSERLHQLRGDDVFENFMNAYGTSIDPHTSYMSPRSADNFNMTMKLSLEGVGAVLQNQDDYVVFRTIMPGSPAEKSGVIKAGDRVLAVGQLPGCRCSRACRARKARWSTWSAGASTTWYRRSAGRKVRWCASMCNPAMRAWTVRIRSCASCATK